MIKLSIDRHRDLLLVVDVQNDFCTGGALEVKNGEAVVPVINGLIDRFGHVILTQDWHPPDHMSFASQHPGKEPLAQIEVEYGRQTLWPDHCVQGTPGADFHPGLHTRAARLIVRKGMNPRIDSYSGFFENDRVTPTGLGAAIHGIGAERIFLAGLATDFCVLYTALDARRIGFEVVLVRDATRGIDLDGSVAHALAAIGEAGGTSLESTGIV